MAFYVKVAAFWLLVIGAIWLLARFPGSRLSRLAFSWHGPRPAVGESKSHLMFRWATYSLAWLCQIILVSACGWLATWWHPPMADYQLFMAVWAFALPLLGGMALLGATLTVCAGLKARLIGPDPVFTMSDDGTLA